MYKSKKPYHYGTVPLEFSVAGVHLIPNGTGFITINGRDIEEYFGLETLKMVVRQPLNTTGTIGKVDVEATVTGGGVTGQAGALRHGIARALLEMDPEFRTALKAAGFLTRDPRMKERKKYGLKAARRAPQFEQALIFFQYFQNCRPDGRQFFAPSALRTCFPCLRLHMESPRRVKTRRGLSIILALHFHWAPLSTSAA